MEFTNWFFILHILLQQLRSKRQMLRNVNYGLLIVAFGTCRIGVCTAMMVMFSRDIFTVFSSDNAGEWFCVGLQYAVFAFVWALSFYFVYAELKPVIKPMLARRQSKAKQVDTTRPKPGFITQTTAEAV